MVLGLVWELFLRFAGQSDGGLIGLGPGDPGRQLEHVANNCRVALRGNGYPSETGTVGLRPARSSVP